MAGLYLEIKLLLMTLFTQLRSTLLVTGVVFCSVSFGANYIFEPPGANDSAAYKIEPLGINSAKSDYAPVFYKNGPLIFSSNRCKSKAMYDKWTMGRYSKIFVAKLDSTGKAEIIKLKPKAKSSSGSAAFNTV